MGCTRVRSGATTPPEPAAGPATMTATASPTAPVMTATSRSHSVHLHADGRVECEGPRRAPRCRVPAGLGPAVAVAAGWSHSAALLADGRVVCWGHNGRRQCELPAELDRVDAISAGDLHTAVRLADRRTRVFGAECAGVPWEVPVDQIVDLLASSGRSIAGSFGDALAMRLPPGRIVERGEGMHHRIARTDDGRVLCWGGNAMRQCEVPPDLGRAVAVAAGRYHSVALDAAGKVFCWGSDKQRQCSIPADLGKVQAIAAGDRHTIALLPDGNIKAWGNTYHSDESIPARLRMPIRAIYAHGHGNWAVDGDGRLHCWGDCLRTQRVPFTLSDEVWLEFAVRTWNQTQRQIFPRHIRQSPQFKAIRALNRLCQP